MTDHHRDDAIAAAEALEHDDPGERWEWLHVILDLPKIGGFLCFWLAAAPLFAIMVIHEILFAGPSDAGMTDGELGVAVLVALPPTWWWLRLLERKAGVGLCLPLPIVNIPIRWTLAPVGLAILASRAGLL